MIDNRILAAENAEAQQHFDDSEIQTEIGYWRRAAAMIFMGGAAAATLGLLLNAISWFSSSEAAFSDADQIGTKLILAAIPALLITAFCLNKLEILHDAEKTKISAQNGMSRR